MIYEDIRIVGDRKIHHRIFKRSLFYKLRMWLVVKLVRDDSIVMNMDFIGCDVVHDTIQDRARIEPTVKSNA